VKARLRLPGCILSLGGQIASLDRLGEWGVGFLPRRSHRFLTREVLREEDGGFSIAVVLRRTLWNP